MTWSKRYRRSGRSGTVSGWLVGGTPLAHQCFMSNASTRNEGKGEEIGGKIKAGVGKLIGNEQMEAEGKGRELIGEARKKANK